MCGPAAMNEQLSDQYAREFWSGTREHSAR